MEAKDTVINHNESGGSGVYTRKEIEKQAEISFKAGEQLALEKQGTAFLEGKQEGRKEVVEWIKSYSQTNKNQYDESWGFLLLDPEDWEAKLKSWGIK